GHAATYCSDPHLISSHAFSKNRAQPAIALKSDTSALPRFYTASVDRGRAGTAGWHVAGAVRIRFEHDHSHDSNIFHNRRIAALHPRWAMAGGLLLEGADFLGLASATTIIIIFSPVARWE
ncbi:MAG: hypothetical protein ACSLE1_12470, partial [Sphingobium sp.]